MKLQLLPSPRGPGTPQGAGDVHWGPCLPRPLQGPGCGARTAKEFGQQCKTGRVSRSLLCGMWFCSPCPPLGTGTHFMCKTTDSGLCQGSAASRSSSAAGAGAHHLAPQILLEVY